jgi:hypothetical protein
VSLYTNYRGSLVLNDPAAPASGARGVEDKKDGKDTAQAKTIVIFSAPEDEDLNATGEELHKLCSENGVSCDHLQIEGRDLATNISELRSKGMIGDKTQIFLSFHGELGKDDANNHDVTLGREDSDFRDRDGSVLAILGAIREPLEGSDMPCAATVYIAACESGGQDFATRVQQLHNRYNVGVCFLLSGKGTVTMGENSNALNTVCEQFIAAKNSHSDSPTAEHLCAVVTARAADCMSVVVARESQPRRYHRPERPEDAGAEALMRRLDSDALVFTPGKGISFGLTAAEKGDFQTHHIPKRNVGTHYSISGDFDALSKQKDKLSRLDNKDNKII